MPVTYAGNISTLHDIHSLFSLGIERLCFNRSLLRDLDFIKAGMNIYGKQSFVASIDLKKPLLRNPQAVFRRSNRFLPTKYKNISLLLDRVVSSNIFGEIHLNCIDTQGTFRGLPHYINSFPPLYDIPMTVGGGITTCNHIHEAFSSGFSGVIASSSLYFSEPSLSALNSVNINYPFESCIDQIAYD
ncbi:histidine biosynthesis family protein [Synechococcus sp. WH 8103]|nr:histidine biosynthesis family protein [Synechococcus sp. WH 8103]